MMLDMAERDNTGYHINDATLIWFFFQKPFQDEKEMLEKTKKILQKNTDT